MLFLHALLIAIMTALGGLPSFSQQAAPRYTYIEDHTGSAWPVKDVRAFIDQYTSSGLIYGNCRAGAACIKVYEKEINTNWTAYTFFDAHPNDWNATDVAIINVNPRYAKTSYAVRRNTVAHEIAHAQGVTWHSTVCSNLMWPSSFCPTGKVKPYVFTPAAKLALSKN